MVVIIAPHTSMLDFIIGKLYYLSIKRKSKFIIKKELFFFPLGLILKMMGAIPVDRKKGGMIFRDIIKKFNESDEFILNITPEGTRKKVSKWKRGFYDIVKEANVPLAIGCIDYGKKQIGIMTMFDISGDFSKDIIKIKNLYKDVQGRHPENFTVV
ncbi:MAG: 1-acyl-sn-glycerol-3-phosphate acyltransferase [Marinilabiliales bacterium]